MHWSRPRSPRAIYDPARRLPCRTLTVPCGAAAFAGARTIRQVPRSIGVALADAGALGVAADRGRHRVGVCGGVPRPRTGLSARHLVEASGRDAAEPGGNRTLSINFF